MTSWKKITLLSLGTIFLLISAAIGAFNFVSMKSVEVHQKSVARSVAAWGDEYSRIRSDAEAARAVEMMEYISRYYVTPHPGYRGTMDSERRLEQQRAATLTKLASALENFTGQKFGTNIQDWTLWKEGKRPSTNSSPYQNGSQRYNP